MRAGKFYVHTVDTSGLVGSYIQAGVMRSRDVCRINSMM